eukprot:1157398-Pelagomonas_calceolata.AAC.3
MLDEGLPRRLASGNLEWEQPVDRAASYDLNHFSNYCDCHQAICAPQAIHRVILYAVKSSLRKGYPHLLCAVLILVHVLKDHHQAKMPAAKKQSLMTPTSEPPTHLVFKSQHCCLGGDMRLKVGAGRQKLHKGPGGRWLPSWH